MPTGRNHIGAAALGDRIFVTGGRPGPVHGGLTTVERYDVRRDRWAPAAPLATARSGHAAVAVRGRLVVFGGEELDGGTTIEQVEAYDPASDRWQPLPEMVTPRHGLGGVAVAGGSTRSRAARGPRSRSRGRSSTSTCPRFGIDRWVRPRPAGARCAAPRRLP